MVDVSVLTRLQPGGPEKCALVPDRA